nr:hypothetical protein CFP56_68510 [Quercus suber]
MRPGTQRKKQRKRQNVNLGILDRAPLIYLGELKHPIQLSASSGNSKVKSSLPSTTRVFCKKSCCIKLRELGCGLL